MKRDLIARSSHLATRQRIYRVADGLEVDEIDHFEVRRSRVLYEDVILMTYHRRRGIWFLLISGLIAAGFGVLSFLIIKDEAIAGWTVAGITFLPAFLIFATRLIFGIDEVNVYSRRSQANMRFVFRKGRARELMNEIAEVIRQRQQSASPAPTAPIAPYPADAPPAPPEPPPFSTA
jgi:hypothetical protein